MHAEHAQKREQQPGHGIIHPAGIEPHAGGAVHGRDEKKIDDPAHQQQAEGKKVDGPGNRAPVIEPVRSRESENPEQITQQYVVYQWIEKNNKSYYLTKSGIMAKYCYVAGKGGVYYWVNENGEYQKQFDTKTPNLAKYELAV